MNCCSKKIKNKKQCLREDNKIFNLPRRFSQKQCLTQHIRGFTMRASCAPYKFCKQSLKKGGKKTLVFFPPITFLTIDTIEYFQLS